MVLFKVGKDEIIERTRKAYGGPLVIGEDLMSFEIGETVKTLVPSEDSSPRGRQEIVPDL
jgi:ribonuclease Z